MRDFKIVFKNENLSACIGWWALLYLSIGISFRIFMSLIEWQFRLLGQKFGSVWTKLK